MRDEERRKRTKKKKKEEEVRRITKLRFLIWFFSVSYTSYGF